MDLMGPTTIFEGGGNGAARCRAAELDMFHSMCPLDCSVHALEYRRCGCNSAAAVLPARDLRVKIRSIPYHPDAKVDDDACTQLCACCNAHVV